MKWSFYKERSINRRRGIILGYDSISSLIEPQTDGKFYYCVCCETFGGLYHDGYCRSLEEGKYMLRVWLKANIAFVENEQQESDIEKNTN